MSCYICYNTILRTEKTYPYFTDLTLVAELDIGSIIYRLYENRIFHAIIKEGEKVEMFMVERGYQFLDEQGGGKYYNIYQFSSFADLEPEVRDLFAQTKEISYTYVDAIVITNFAQKIIADFYMKISKPVHLTKIFFSPEKALEWIKIQVKAN